MTSDEAPKRPRDPVADQIDQNLRRVYQDVIKEGIPPRFDQLLEELRRKGVGK